MEFTRIPLASTHLDLRRKNFVLVDGFFLVLSFNAFDALQTTLSSFWLSHFDLLAHFDDFAIPNSVLSVIGLLLLDACSCCCFFDVVKLCKKLNIRLRVIAHLSTPLVWWCYRQRTQMKTRISGITNQFIYAWYIGLAPWLACHFSSLNCECVVFFSLSISLRQFQLDDMLTGK